jgi:pimeloyl-ACP methyl ester carboxylesterase
MNSKVFSMATAMLAIIALTIVTLSILTGAGSHSHGGKYVEKAISLPTGVTLNYVEQGKADGIPIILLHGFTDSWHSFEHVLDKFPKNLHVMAISQRGHGNSTKTVNTDHASYFASDVAAFIDEKNLGPCIIVGHSLGGIITQQFALDYPHLTLAIVLAGSEACFYDNEGIPEFVAEINKLNDPIDRTFAEQFQWSTISQPVDSAIMEEFINESMKVPAKVWRSVGDLLMTTNYSDQLKNIKVPTLILWGDQDATCRLAGQQQLKAGITDSKLIVHKGVGHALHWEDGARFASEIVVFVNALE